MGQAIVRMKKEVRVGGDGHCMQALKTDKPFLMTHLGNGMASISRPGHGEIGGDYGNGSLYLWDLDDAEFLTGVHLDGVLTMDSLKEFEE